MYNPIWNIGLFTKIDKFTAECFECKKNNRPNYTIKLPNYSTHGLETHLKSKLHQNSEHSKKYDELLAKQRPVKVIVEKGFQKTNDACPAILPFSIEDFVTKITPGYTYILLSNINFKGII